MLSFANVSPFLKVYFAVLPQMTVRAPPRSVVGLNGTVRGMSRSRIHQPFHACVRAESGPVITSPFPFLEVAADGLPKGFYLCHSG
ncbi:hypothetical protein [Streptomyces sp. NPDC058011]|uniref:hypothetical protein n=1 Tax=Streptomyces sp. NPDC058011 TaxID=3346305 RepID=UPI0036ECB14B